MARNWSLEDLPPKMRKQAEAQLTRDGNPRKRVYSQGPAHLRAMTHVAVDEKGCWIWQGSKTPAGYGHINIGSGKYRHAHSVLYEHHKGPVPEGLELDHLCRDRACVNPDHLEAVTPAENTRRGLAAVRSCDHPESEFYRRKSTGRVVYCRACRRAKRQEASAGAISEAEFQKSVIDLAQTLEWSVAHFRPAQNGRGEWRTAVAADGKGFPDLVLCRDRIIFAELKSTSGRLGSDQIAWRFALERADAEIYVWRPDDWPLIEAALARRKA